MLYPLSHKRFWWGKKRGWKNFQMYPLSFSNSFFDFFFFLDLLFHFFFLFSIDYILFLLTIWHCKLPVIQQSMRPLSIMFWNTIGQAFKKNTNHSQQIGVFKKLPNNLKHQVKLIQGPLTIYLAPEKLNSLPLRCNCRASKRFRESFSHRLYII